MLVDGTLFFAGGEKGIVIDKAGKGIGLFFKRSGKGERGKGTGKGTDLFFIFLSD